MKNVLPFMKNKAKTREKIFFHCLARDFSAHLPTKAARETLVACFLQFQNLFVRLCL